MFTRRRAKAAAFWKLSAAAGLAFLTVSGASAAQAVEACDPASIWVNSGGSNSNVLQEFVVDPATGELTEGVTHPLDRDYGDIALSPDGQTLYGVDFTVSKNIVHLDMASGAALSQVRFDQTLRPDEVPAEVLNSLSFTADGKLYTGGPTSSSMYIVDPVTGSAESVVDFPNLDGGSSAYAAGDFLTLPDGDILAVLSGTGQVSDSQTYLARISSDYSSTEIVAAIDAQVFGAAQSGGWIYLPASNGNVYGLEAVPQTGSETNNITDQLTVAWSNPDVEWWGATSAQDAGGCAVPGGVHPEPEPVEDPATSPRVPERVETGL